jgi:hypothetical protein
MDLLCLADAATVDAGGKLNILGAYDAVALPEFPGTTRLVVALRLIGQAADAGTHGLRVVLVDADGQILAEGPPTTIGVAAGPDASGRFALPGVLVMAPTFPCPGEYAVDVSIDGTQVGSYPVHVRLSTQILTV